jgi:hypothetical protein
MANNIITICSQMGGKFVPITGKPMTHEEFTTILLLENENSGLSPQQILGFACGLQKKYNVCIGGPDIIETQMQNFMDNLGTLQQSGIDEYTRMELDLSRKRKILTILVDKVLSNNESGSTQQTLP